MQARLLAAALVGAALLTAAGCSSNSSAIRPTPTPSAAVACASGDAPLVEQTLGWAFCIPGGWKYRERIQGTQNPSGVDATFDITDFSQGPTNGLFGFMIVSTDERPSGMALADWVSANVQQGLNLEPIDWGNAEQAAHEVGGSRYFAFTPHHVVVVDLHSGAGNLDLVSAIQSRLGTWKFTY